MSKANIKRIVILSVGIAMLIVFTVFTCILSGFGKNYTEEYKIHLALSELGTIEEVENYLTANQVSYEINNSTLTLNDYDNIKYVIRTDNSTGHLVPSDKCLLLEKLDAKDYEVVTVNKVATEDGWNEHVFLKSGGNTYSKYNGEYFIQHTTALEVVKRISLLFFIGIGVYLALDYLDLYVKMKKRAAQTKPAKEPADNNQ